MIRLHTSPSAVEIRNLQNVLETEGIACEVRGEFRKTAVGELPPNECWVELWLRDDADEAAARRILDASEDADRSPWTCTHCGESVEGQFARCWNCERDR